MLGPVRSAAGGVGTPPPAAALCCWGGRDRGDIFRLGTEQVRSPVQVGSRVAMRSGFAHCPL